MDRDTARTVVVALAAVVAIALAAATLNSTVVPDDSGGTGFGSDGQVGVGDNRGDDVFPGGGTGELGTAGQPLTLCVELLRQPWVQAAILATALLAGYVVTRRLNVLAAFAFGGAFGLPFLLVYMALTSCGGSGTGPLALFRSRSNNSSGLPAGGIGGFESGQTVVRSPTSVLLLVVLGGALVVSLALLVRATGDEDRIEPPEDPETAPEPDVAAVGRVAGRAADRIEAATDLENEVYRAWDEMTTFLEVDNHESSTPAEFAAAAVEAGMARDDVDELTGLFEEVRYGGAAPTADREDRAVAALRRIESTYAEGGS